MKHTFHDVARRTNSSGDFGQPATKERAKLLRHQKTGREEREVTQLVCPSCMNKSASREEANRHLKSAKSLKEKEGTSINDLCKQANEDIIKVKIANRAQMTYDASQSIAIFKNAMKSKLQQSNEAQSDYFITTDHTLQRAKERNGELEKLIRTHPEQFAPKDKQSMLKYYQTYVKQGLTSIQLKSLSCPPSIKENYSNALQSQIEQDKQRLRNAKRDEANADRLALLNSMNQSSKTLKCKRAVDNDLELQCAEENDRIIVMKNRRRHEQMEMNDKMDRDYLEGNRKERSDYNKAMLDKRNQMSNILVYNKQMDNVKQLKSNEEKKSDLQYKNKGYLRELICQHGCQAYRCAICLREFPRRVLTPVVVRMKK